MARKRQSVSTFLRVAATSVLVTLSVQMAAFALIVPSTPTLSSPTNGATSVSTSPTLSWNSAMGAETYTVQVSTSSTFGTSPIQKTDLTGTSTSVTGLAANTKYYWRVNATNLIGNSPWSSVWSFTTASSGTTPPPPPPPSSQTPYKGTPFAIPGTIQAEDFDNGGEGVAYHDADASNQGGAYRSTGVDLKAASTGGYYIGWTAANEWTEYTVNVSTAGSYTMNCRVASGTSGGSFRVEFGGVSKATITVPGTGGWDTWKTVTATVSLSAGQQIMRIYMVSAGYNVNDLAFAAASTPTPTPTPTPGQTPFKGSPIAVPGTIQAEDFDNGGEGVAYHDVESANQGGAYRSTGVDLQSCSAGGYNVGWTRDGEWLEYTVNVAAAGSHQLTFSVAAPLAGGALRAELNGVNVTGTLAVPATGNWQTWKTMSKTVTLAAGQQVLRVFIEKGSFNFDKLVITKVLAKKALSVAQNHTAGLFRTAHGAKVVLAPEMRGVEVVDLSGKLVWQFHRTDKGWTTAEMPDRIARPGLVVKARFLK